MGNIDLDDEEIRQRRERRNQRMKEEKRRQVQQRLVARLVVFAGLFVLVLVLLVNGMKKIIHAD